MGFGYEIIRVIREIRGESFRGLTAVVPGHSWSFSLQTLLVDRAEAYPG